LETYTLLVTGECYHESIGEVHGKQTKTQGKSVKNTIIYSENKIFSKEMQQFLDYEHEQWIWKNDRVTGLGRGVFYLNLKIEMI
jgi:hypothetical protein